VATASQNKDFPQMEVGDLSLREKVGQVLMVGFSGKDPEGAAVAVRDLKVGGIIYFARNTGTVAETAALSQALQDMAASCGNLPLLISVDQEGGPVVRLDRGLPLMPGPMSLGATGDPELALKVARAAGIQVRAAGINMNLAPVLDVNDNPDNPVIGVRSFGSDPSLVETLGTESVQGFLSAGIAPVGKHFPGHGNTSVDSHLELPVLPHPMKRLAEVELKPFRAAIRKGLPAIMTAHIIFKAIDPHRPATLSEPVLQGLLRRDLGFQGLIMTDCMEMNAISEYFGTARGAVLALKAGADMVLISHTPELQREACEMLVEAVQTGEIPLSRLDEAVRRILSLKKALRIPNPLPPGAADTEEFSRLSAEAHRRSITILRDAGLPVGSNESSRIVIASSYPERALGEALREMGAQVVHLAYDSPAFSEMTAPGVTTSGATAPGTTTPGTTTPGTTTPGATAPGVTTRREELNQADTVIILTRNAWKNEKQAAWVRSILREKPGAVLVATGDPYDFRVFPDARAFVCTYSHRPEALRALAEALTGAVKAEGRLPVRL
jgi:beta-N-acetylhexosaminidase